MAPGDSLKGRVKGVLTIVGSSVRAAAVSAARAGYRVRAGDLFADVDLCRIADATRVDRYPAGLAAVVGGRQPGSWMYTGALENHPSLVGRLARQRPLWGNPAAVLRRVRNPRLVAEALRRSGICCPAVSFDPRDVPRDGTWLAKPRRSAGGSRIAFWTDRPSAAALRRGCYYQQYIEGMPCAAVYVAAGGRAVLLGVTRQLIGEPWAGASGFRYCGSVGPAPLPPEAIASFAKIGNVLAAAFGLVGLFGVDAVVNSAGVWPVEVNPRYTASVEVLERSGISPAIGAHADACQRQRLPRRPSPSHMISGKVILFATSRLVIPARWADRAASEHEEHRPSLADIPADGTIVEAGWPVVTLFADRADETAVLASLRGAAKSVLATIRP